MPWYYSLETKPIGPVEDFELDHLARRGIVRWDTFVWTKGETEWKPYGEIFNRTSVHCDQCGRKTIPEVATPFAGNFICLDCHDLFFQKIREGCPTPGLIRYGGFWLRVAAKLIDGAALGALQTPIALLFVFLSFPFLTKAHAGEGFDQSMGLYLGIRATGWLMQFLVTIAYYTFFGGKLGATPGKLCLGLRIVRSDFSKISYRTALMRCLAEFISGLVLDLGYLMAAFDDQKRTLHDYLCTTRVVKKNSLEYARRQMS